MPGHYFKEGEEKGRLSPCKFQPEKINQKTLPPFVSTNFQPASAEQGETAKGSLKLLF